MPRTTPRAINVKIKRSARTTVPERRAGKIRCSTWSKKSVAYMRARVRRATAFLASSGVLGGWVVVAPPDKFGPAKAAGLDGETFRFEPFLKQSDLRGAAGAV